jgi:beta-1,4-N-acetylglucosaminyltransferase
VVPSAISIAWYGGLFIHKSTQTRMSKRSIFVTVGTTRFDPLIEAVTRVDALQWMKQNGYTHLVIQYGKGREPAVAEMIEDAEQKNTFWMDIRSYSFQPSLEQDMNEADLLISHAGAGTIMEALRLQKRLVVVINTSLMDNHQTELAHAMAHRNHLFVVDNPANLQNVNTWNDLNAFVPIPHVVGENDFPILLNTHLGVAVATKEE